MHDCNALDFSCHLSNLGQLLLEAFNWIWQQLLEGAVAILSLIPVPSWLSSGSFALPDGVLFFAAALEINTGIGIVISAYTIRFLIRRIPVIG